MSELMEVAKRLRGYARGYEYGEVDAEERADLLAARAWSLLRALKEGA